MICAILCRKYMISNHGGFEIRLYFEFGVLSDEAFLSIAKLLIVA